jgi:hypothetical protein
MGYDGMGCDGMGYDGMGYDGMEYDGIKLSQNDYLSLTDRTERQKCI